ncbi:MAG: hypothetical protein KGL67_00510 [Patescibacteria group bacterium]|nr:hypothetical protein [Patescibacteria group bacterium]
MTEKLQQIIKREVAKLPKYTQEAITSLDWGNVIEQIGKKYSFNESELNDLHVQTLLVLIGLTDPNLYAKNIENEVGTTKDEAEKIASEAFEKIFEPINNILEEKIKKNMKDKKTDVVQNVNFILSGGDYSVFVDDANVGSLNSQKTDKLIGTSNILETKKRLID